MLAEQIGGLNQGTNEKTDQSRYDKIYRHIHGLYPPTLCNKNTVYELEGRLGRICGDKFIAGVSSVWFQTLAVRLDRYSGWTEQTQWVEIEDTFFTHDGHEFRQSRVCDAVNCQVNLFTIEKKQGKNCVIPTPKLSVIQNDILPTDVGAIRLAQAEEITLDQQQLPSVVTPTYIRIKQRKTFFLDSRKHDGAKWKFELTRSWGGKTREEAEIFQNTTEPTNEVEVEWLPSSEAPPLTHDEYKRVLVSLVDKLCSLLV